MKTKSTTTIELTQPVLMAINTAFAELANNGDWTAHYSEEDIDTIFKVMKQFEQIKIK